jgi:hypothetical protein
MVQLFDRLFMLCCQAIYENSHEWEEWEWLERRRRFLSDCLLFVVIALGSLVVIYVIRVLMGIDDVPWR